jgi:CheY-like chemotaxis protein
VFRILLVDDKPGDRELLREFLISRGAHVTEAANDRDAYQVINAANREDFDLLLTDVNLGVGTTGFDIARSARTVFPELLVIYMTAFDIHMEAHAVEGSLCVRKPMQLGELADQVLDFAAASRKRLPGETSRDSDAIEA